MTLTRISEQSWRPGLAWSWRTEREVVLRALRSVYPYFLLLLALLATTVAYQRPDPIAVTVGGGYDAPYVRAFQEREEIDGQRYRWATGRARVLLPGVGARPSTLTITAAARPDGAPEPVQVVVNGIALGQFTPTSQLAPHRFALPANHFSYGDLTVDLLSTPQQVPGKGTSTLLYGPKVAEVRVEPQAGVGGLTKPALRPLAAWAIIGPLLYALLLRLGLRPWAAAATSLVALLVGAATTAVQRLDLALFAPRLAFLVALAYLLLVGTDLVVPRLYRRGGVEISPRAWRLLQLTFLLAFVLKLGGIVYPQLFVVDYPWHSQQFEKVLQGRFFEIYRPSAIGISNLPNHWGITGQLPYSPFLFLLGLPFYLFPLGRELSINVWAGLLDVSRILLVFYLARRLGASARAGLIAAFIIGLTPSTFLLHSWGNYPTTYSQYLALLFLTLLVAGYDALRRPAVFAGLTALLTVAMLLYTVTAVFIGLFLLVLLAGLAWRGGPDARRGLAPLAGILVLASGLAFALYYVQFVGPLLTETLPHVLGQLEEGKAIGGIERDSAGLYSWKYVGRLLSYGILASLLLAPLGAWWLLRGARSRLAGPMLAGWFAVFALFYFVGMRLDMVDKEMWFALPAVAICAGVTCDRLLQRFPRQALSRALVTVYLSYLASGGAILWVLRIVYTRH